MDIWIEKSFIAGKCCQRNDNDQTNEVTENYSNSLRNSLPKSHRIDIDIDMMSPIMGSVS